nr:Chain A, Cathelicidin antimicrobial peptide [Homo sapiens]6S6M_B Chain B, Cathelicidin antimicrobial peptide [Homo sapiens]
FKRIVQRIKDFLR